MATPQTPTEVLADAIKRVLSSPIVASLHDMAVLAHMPVGTLVVQLVERDVASFRSQNIAPDFLFSSEMTSEAPIDADDIHRTKTSNKLRKKVRRLLAEGEMTIDAIAKRCNVSRSTVRRIQDEDDE